MSGGDDGGGDGDNDSVTVRYTTGVKAGLLVGLPAFTLLSAVLFFSALNRLPEKPRDLLVLAAMAICASWFVVEGARLLPYLGVVIRVYGDRLEVARRGTIETIPANEIGRIRRAWPLQILKVRRRDGSTLFALDYYATNFLILDRTLGRWQRAADAAGRQGPPQGRSLSLGHGALHHASATFIGLVALANAWFAVAGPYESSVLRTIEGAGAILCACVAVDAFVDRWDISPGLVRRRRPWGWREYRLTGRVTVAPGPGDDALWILDERDPVFPAVKLPREYAARLHDVGAALGADVDDGGIA